MTVFQSFSDALQADRPAPPLADRLSLYSWLIGGWEMDAVRHLADGSTARGRGEILFGWVLDGRVIQDVWHVPGPAGSPPSLFGTTLRIYDPAIDAWHIRWIDPIGQNHSQQVGRRDGDDIVQLGADAAGRAVRWRFTEITPASFHWIGEQSPDGGKSWVRIVEFFARRAGD